MAPCCCPPSCAGTAGVEPGADLVAEVQGGRVVVGPVRLTLAERLAALTADAPPEELDKLPDRRSLAASTTICTATPKRAE